MIKHIQAHNDICSLCRREKIQADKYQLHTTEIPKTFAKVSIDLIVEMPTSHYGNKNILVMVDHLISWQMVKSIPDKEATTVANAIFEKLILEYGSLEILLSDNGKYSQMTLWPMSARSLGMSNILLPLYSQVKWQDKVSIRKLCQEDQASWDQVLDQILFSYRYCPHNSTGDTPYTLVYNKDPPIPIHKLIKVVEPYLGENTLGKRIEKSRVSLSIAAQMFGMMRTNQKSYYQNRRSTHTFKVHDWVLLKKAQC